MSTAIYRHGPSLECTLVPVLDIPSDKPPPTKETMYVQFARKVVVIGEHALKAN